MARAENLFFSLSDWRSFMMLGNFTQAASFPHIGDQIAPRASMAHNDARWSAKSASITDE
jgi:hypothetical protein